MTSCPLLTRSTEDRATNPANKRRKPAVEKLRRDRINSSIAQLRRLLEEEVQRQQPQCRLEKADILELAVAHLEQQRRLRLRGTFPDADRQGYAKCLCESVVFLSAQNPWGDPQAEVLEHFRRDPVAVGKQGTPAHICPPSSEQTAQKEASPHGCKTLWRP
ncbi:transcription factor HES-5-like isoform X2 [Ambystoma mexicanum]